MALRVISGIKKAIDCAIKVRIKPDTTGIVTDWSKHTSLQNLIGTINNPIEKEVSITRNDSNAYTEGISVQEDGIDETNIVELMKTIPFLNQNRSSVLGVLQQKIYKYHWKFNSKILCQICNTLLNRNDHGPFPNVPPAHWEYIPPSIFSYLVRSLHYNLNSLAEDELLIITKTFLIFNYYDLGFEKLLEKYMKIRGLKISSISLVAGIMEYVKHFRIRSPGILEAAANFLVLNQTKLYSNPLDFTSIFVPFGILNYQPVQGIQFWEAIENYLRQNFIRIPPSEFVDCLLSCLYLQKYPINFVSSTFSPHFLDRLLQNEKSKSFTNLQRSKVKLLDISLALECGSKYGGPFLPKDFSAKSILQDGRIAKALRTLEKPMSIIFPDRDIQSSIALPNLPLNELYIVDFVIGPKRVNNVTQSSNEPKYMSLIREMSVTTNVQKESPLKTHMNLRNSDSERCIRRSRQGWVALLVQIPEHYSLDGKHLLGHQKMRIRHLKHLGFQVILIHYSMLPFFTRKENEDPDNVVKFLNPVINSQLETALECECR